MTQDMEVNLSLVEDIIQQFVSKYELDDSVLGFFVIGSAANGTMDEHSDIDILCVTNTRPELSRESYTKSGIPIEVLYNSESELTEYINEEFGSVYRTISHMIHSGKLKLDKFGKLADIAALAQKAIASATVLTDEQSMMIRYSIADFYSDAKRAHNANNQAEFLLYSDKLINNAVEASLRLTNGYFLSVRQLMPALAKSDAELHEMIQVFFKTAFKEQLSALNSIAEYGYSKLGGRLPDDWHITNR